MPTNLTDRLGELVDKVTPGPVDVYPQPIGSADDAKAELAFQVDTTEDRQPFLFLLNAGGKCPATTGCGPTSQANAEFIALCFTHKGEILSALRKAEDGWLSIESAPKDGSVILLTSASPLWKYPLPAEWHKKQDRWVFADEPLSDVWAVSDLVTHWMPLPAPPTTGGSND